MTKLMIGLMMAGALFVGCDKGGGDAKTDGTAKGAEKGAASGESTGAKECDEYIKDIEECAKKNPAMGKAQLDSLDGLRTAWKAGLSNAATKETTIQGCKAGADGLKQTCLK